MRVVVAEDSVLLREGIVRLLEDGGVEVAGQAGDGEELLALVERHRPDVALVDMRMPPGHSDEGLRAAIRIREAHGEAVGVLFLSQFAEPDIAFRALAIGDRGVGYLLKERVRDVDELRDAVSRVASGGFVVDPEVVARLVGRRREADPLATLSAREREVLELMAEGRSNQAIADRMALALKTVEAYIATIFSKLGLEPGPSDHRRVLAVLAWLRGT